MEADSTGNGGVMRRRGFTSFNKNDFFPEESFRSWENYGKAFIETPLRLKDRILTRSKDQQELVEMKARSKHEMKRTLNWWDIMWFGIGATIGSGIFVLTGLEAHDAAGPAVVLSYVISGISALLSVFCYTEFAVEIPVAGGSFAYLRVELGGFVAFIAAGNILLEYIIGGAAAARSLTSYFATLCNKDRDQFRIVIPNMNPNYSHLDPISVAIVLLIILIAVKSTKVSSIFNSIASVIHLLVISFIIVAGLMNANPDNYKNFAPFGARGVFQASAVLFFAYVGFDAVATMAEETKDPGKDIPIGLIGSMVLTTLIYCILAVTLCLMQPYQNIDVNAPFSVAFSGTRMNWAKYLVAFGALKGMTTVLLVNSVGQARYLTHIARTHMMPPWFAQVDEKTETPVNATITMLLASAAISFFTDLQILANLLSIATLLIFMLVALALLVRRYYSSGVTTKSDHAKLILCLSLIVGSSCGISAFWAINDGWIGFTVFGPVWVFGTGYLAFGVPMAKQPTIWGVPLVPWIPFMSIFINIFLLGSIDTDSFVRFGVWTAFLLVYYVLLGLHASYDTAKELEDRNVSEQNDKELKEVEEGNTSTSSSSS